MNCKDIEKIIPRFLNHECSEKEEALILEHIRTCKECREEMTIQLLLAEGLGRLESGESFDLNEEMEKRLKEKVKEKRQPKKRISHETSKIIIDIITGAIIVAVIVGLLIWQIH